MSVIVFDSSIILSVEVRITTTREFLSPRSSQKKNNGTERPGNLLVMEDGARAPSSMHH